MSILWSERFTFRTGYPEIFEWLTDRLLSIDFKISKMETVLFLSALPNDLYEMVLAVMEKYGRMEIKGQKATKRNLKAGLKTTVDCPSYNFKCLRGDLSKEEISDLLNSLLEGKMTFSDLKQEASRIKEIKEVQRLFIVHTGSKNWEEVAKRLVDYRLIEEGRQVFDPNCRYQTNQYYYLGNSRIILNKTER